MNKQQEKKNGNFLLMFFVLIKNVFPYMNKQQEKKNGNFLLMFFCVDQKCFSLHE